MIYLPDYASWSEDTYLDELLSYDDATYWDEANNGSVLFDYLWYAHETIHEPTITYYSPVYNISSEVPIKSCRIGWWEQIPKGCSVNVQTSISTDGGKTWSQWSNILPHGHVTGIKEGNIYRNTLLKYKVTLAGGSVGITPIASDFRVKLEYLYNPLKELFVLPISQTRSGKYDFIPVEYIQQKEKFFGPTKEYWIIPTNGILDRDQSTIDFWFYKDQNLDNLTQDQYLLSWPTLNQTGNMLAILKNSLNKYRAILKDYNGTDNIIETQDILN